MHHRRDARLGLFLGIWLLISPWALAGEARLSWIAPTTNTDGSPLTDLAGHRVYYGQASGTYTIVLDVGLATSALISELTPGQTYYFTVTAYDTSGNESVGAEERWKTIPPEVIDTTPPVVAITDPVPGASVPRRATVEIQVEASDDGGVTEVTMTVSRNGAVIHHCADSVQPYTCTWPVPAANRQLYTLQATARDAAGNLGVSTPVQVTAR